MKILTTFLLFLFLNSTLIAQKELTYYLPDIKYDNNVPTPEEILGYQVGEWHVSHDQLVNYMQALARTSDRVTIETFARTYEHRPLLLLTITSPNNHKNINKIREQHVELTNPEKSKKLNTNKMPIVLYQGYSIHGNESSGSNAALLYAYYLAAGQSDEVKKVLENTVVLLDPSFNPDGLHRFSTWVNMHKNEYLTPNGEDREYNEVWPGGRTNHYWFDLNRDWLPTQHPESQGRIANFHKWKPNILTDHHEMGTNSTFFFQPGVLDRTHPWTPIKNQELTGKIGTYHAAELDKIGSTYFTKESFDDFYYGKGSTYPDVNGGIGILFEQASSRGHLQNSQNGLLSFPFTIRNQVVTSFSTLNAAQDMRQELLDYQREFYSSAIETAKKDNIKSIVFSDPHNQNKVAHFIEMLNRHQIEIHQATDDIGKFPKASTYIVPLNQPQYRLIKAIFEKRTTFKDSSFYDVSAFNLAMAFNIPYLESTTAHKLGERVTQAPFPKGSVIGTSNKAYGYIFEWDEYYAPRAAYELLQAGMDLKVAARQISIPTSEGTTNFDYGSIFVPIGNNQTLSKTAIEALVQKVAKNNGIKIHTIETGLTVSGPSLGSKNFKTLRLPKVLLVIGQGTNSYEAGETWHLLDQRFHIPVTKVEISRFGRTDLSKYNVVILAGGSYGGLSKDKMSKWLQEGGTLVALHTATRWASNQGFSNVKFTSSSPSKDDGQRPYIKASQDRATNVIGGAIYETKIDLTHPLAYGYNQELLPVFRRGTSSFQLPNNAYAAPFVYTNTPLLSGYSSNKNIKKIRNTAAVVVSSEGRGKVIAIADVPNFRAFWYGTNKLFLNSIFFGHTIDWGTTE